MPAKRVLRGRSGRGGEHGEHGAAPAARAAKRREARRARYECLFAPLPLAIFGAALSAAFLFQPSMTARLAMLALFTTGAWLAGKRISPLAASVTVLGIVAANLLIPLGRVLLRAGPFVITETALLEGLKKALIFEGLVYASKASILPSLKLPGRFGAIVSSAFIYYERIIEFRGRLRPASLIADADALMLAVWETPPEKSAAQPQPQGREATRCARRRKAGTMLLAALTLLSYAALIALSSGPRS